MRYIPVVLLIIVLVLVAICTGASASSASPDLYAELGLSRRATHNDIRSAFRKLTKEWHPDSSAHPDAKERYPKMLRAYNILKDEEKRRMYDVHGVIEGENGAPTAEERRRRGSMNPFEFFFNEFNGRHGGGGGPGGENPFGGGGGHRESQKIPLVAPELTVETFSRMKLFRGPRMFCVFVYADVSMESRIFASAWERISSPSSFGQGSAAEAFRNVVAFYRLNVQTDSFVMELAGIEPRELPLVMVVRDGVATVIDDDAVQIMPSNPAGMADVLAMYVVDFVNVLMGEAETATPVLKSRQDAEQFLSVNRFHLVLFLDKSRNNQNDINALPCIAAVRSTFADIVVAFVESANSVFSSCPGAVGRKPINDVAWLFRSRTEPSLCQPEQRIAFNSLFSQGSLVRSIASLIRIKQPFQPKDGDSLLLRPSVVWPEARNQAELAASTASSATAGRHPFRLVTRTTVTSFVDFSCSGTSSSSSFSLVQLVSGNASPKQLAILKQPGSTVIDAPIIDVDKHKLLLDALNRRLAQQKLKTVHELLVSGNTHVAFLVMTPSMVCLVPRTATLLAPAVAEKIVSLDRCQSGEIEGGGADTKFDAISMFDSTLSSSDQNNKNSKSGKSKKEREGRHNKAPHPDDVASGGDPSIDIPPEELDADDVRREDANVGSAGGAVGWLEDHLTQDRFPPEPWYANPMRWFFWILRRLPGGAVLIIVVQVAIIYVIKPILARVRGGGGAGAAQPQRDRDVPTAQQNGNNNNSSNLSFYGFQTLDEYVLRASPATTLLVVAVSSDKSPSPLPQQPPPAAAKDLHEITKANGNTAVKLASLNGSVKPASQSVQNLLNTVRATDAFRAQVQAARDGVAWICCRGGTKCRAAVMAPPGRSLRNWIETVLDGSEPLALTF